MLYKKAVLTYFTKSTEKHLRRSLFLIKTQALFSLQLYYEEILTQESILTIFKHVILWSTPSTPRYEARQARHFMEQTNHANFLKRVKLAILSGTPGASVFWGTPWVLFHGGRQARGARGARGGAGALFGRLELRSYVLSRSAIHVATPFTFRW